MFLMNYTRPDIAYAVSRLSRYTHNLSGEHWIALKRLLKYLKGNLDWKLEFVGFPATCIARSTMESEFIALDLAGQEAEWLRSLLADIPLWGRPTPPVSLLCDSQAAICVAKNQIYNVLFELREEQYHQVHSSFRVYEILESRVNLSGLFVHCSDYTHRDEFASKAVDYHDTIRTIMIAPGGEALGGLIGAFWHMIQTEGRPIFAHLKGEKEFNVKQGGQELNAFEQLELGPVRTLLYGAIAGACSEADTYPFEVVRRHLQMQVRATKLSALATCIKKVVFPLFTPD
ncbi:putative mitochondrial adenine nucleotide transporter BTL3 [Hibiscus syriacus]|uniref:Mitochondrial adenine nucleotide transporter BTL3 n=1 Tax=Hibiscus syriacus TaxID=106335 RepID=A0A6A3BID4_HIBSY|nr:putative mitochondrial adenine nucleotide transporter BTL3 [Hibiscus syriacus]